MKKLKILAKPVFLLAFVCAMSVTYASNAADCCQANDKGCIDRFGTKYDFDRPGPVCGPVDV